MTHTEVRERPVLLFIGVVLLLIGIYGALRTVINMVAFEKYPQTGVIGAVPWSGIQPAPSYQREQDCETSYVYTPQLFYEKDGVTSRTPNADEKLQMEQQKQLNDTQLKNCISGVKEARDVAKINDITQSLLLLFLGGSVLLYRRILKLASCI